MSDMERTLIGSRKGKSRTLAIRRPGITNTQKKVEKLEQEGRASEIQLQDAEADGVESERLVLASKRVREFMASFKECYKKAPAFEKKVLLRKCLSKIIVDRERKVARVYVRPVPDVDPRLTEGLKIEAPTTDSSVVGAASSGDRT